MKKLILSLSIISLITMLSPIPSFAASATESAAQDLLDRVATKVATLAERLKHGAAGEITTIGNKSITLDNSQKILTSEATTYYRIRSGSKTTIDFKNLLKGDDIAVVGTADATTGDITARQIIAKVQRLPLIGKVTAIDKKKGLYTLSDKDVEIDGTTVVKTTGAEAITKQKYTDIAVGDNLIVYGYYNKSTDPMTTLKVIVVK